MKVYTSLVELVGKTPLVELKNIEKRFSLKARLFAKVEYFNPAGSVKDRVAYQMIRNAEESGKLNENSVIIEPTSGNTGIGIAAIAASKGYRVIIVMPETMSIERRKLMKAYGAELVLTEGAKGMKGAIEKANELAATLKGGIILGQFTNPSNPEAHYLTTGPEIYSDLGGEVDCFVAGVGTGGTITGVGKYLKERSKTVKIIAVEPAASPVLSGGRAGAHKIQGIGAGFVPEILDTTVYDEVFTVQNESAFDTARTIAKTEGLLVGISSGAALFAAIEKAKANEFADKNIVVLLPDTGERYLSPSLFED